MAQITALLNSAHTHLQQIRVFITNTKSALTHLLSKAESSDNEELSERIQELYDVLKDLKEQEKTYVEYLEEYSNAQSTNRVLRERLNRPEESDRKPVQSKPAVQARATWQSEEDREARLNAIRLANDKQRAQFAEVVGGESDASCTSSSGVEYSAQNVAELRLEQAQLKEQLREEQSRMATLKKYEQSLHQLHKQVESRWLRDSSAEATDSSASMERRKLPFESDTDTTDSDADKHVLRSAVRKAHERAVQQQQRVVPPLELQSRSSRATSDDEDASSIGNVSNSSKSSSTNDRATRKKMREKRRELEEVRARFRRQQALLGSLQRMQAELAATPGLYTAPELLALTNEIINEVSDDQDSVLNDKTLQQQQKTVKVRNREPEEDDRNSSAFASNAESQVATSDDDDDAAKGTCSETDTSSNAVLLSRSQLKYLRRKANLPTDSNTNTSVDDSDVTEPEPEPEPEPKPEPKQVSAPKRERDELQIRKLTDSVRCTADWCQSLARGQERLTDLLTARLPQTPTLTASVKTPTSQTDVLAVLANLQQQVLTQQCEMLRLRQQVIANNQSNSSQFSTLPAFTPRETMASESRRMLPSYSKFDALRERIYSEVGALIAANERRPGFIVQLLTALRSLQTDEQRDHVMHVIHSTVLSHPAKLVRNDNDSASTTSTQRRLFRRLDTIFSAAQPDSDTGSCVSTASTYNLPFGGTLARCASPRKRSKQQPLPEAETSQSESDLETGTESESTVGGLQRLVDESLRAIDTPKLDAFIKSLIGDLIALVRDRLDAPLSADLRNYLRGFVMRSADRLITSSSVHEEEGDFSAFFTRQLDAVLGECMAKYDGVRIRDCCEQLLIDISELLFNEFAFFRVVRNLDDPSGSATATATATSSAAIPTAGVANSEPETPHNSSAAESADESTRNSDSDPPRRAPTLRQPNSERRRNEPLQIELSVCETKPYLRVIHSDEDGQTSDTDADNSNKRRTLGKSRPEDGETDESDSCAMAENGGAFSSSMVAAHSQSDEDPDFLALQLQISESALARMRQAELDAAREHSMLSRMYDESFSVADTSESEVPPDSDADKNGKRKPLLRNSLALQSRTLSVK